MNITGTFLDEITHDIPSANWGVEEWASDFDAMQAVGIDTVILIRAGYRDRATFDSRVLSAAQPMRPCYLDLVDVFLTQAERTGMTSFFGLYDSGRFWHEGQPEKELITFEFSHFMSPNSMWPSARSLYRRYRDYLARPPQPDDPAP